MNQIIKAFGSLIDFQICLCLVKIYKIVLDFIKSLIFLQKEVFRYLKEKIFYKDIFFNNRPSFCLD